MRKTGLSGDRALSAGLPRHGPGVRRPGAWPLSVPCRACGAQVVMVVHLGEQPPGAYFPSRDEAPSQRLPLRLGVCSECGLAQLADRSPPEHDELDGPSPLSSAIMTAHGQRFVDDLSARGLIGATSRVLSLASHGGHLAGFLRDRGVPVTVVDPVEARVGKLLRAGVDAVCGRLDHADAPGVERLGLFDLIVDFYLLAHLEKPRRALEWMAVLLAPGGTLVLEFDHLLATVEGGQWDAIRHGHHTYLTLAWLMREARGAGLSVVDAVPQPVYGGALRVVLQGNGSASRRLEKVVKREADAAVALPAGLAPLQRAVELARQQVVHHLAGARAQGRLVVGYGAPARSITFLNALGIDAQLLPFVVDRDAQKQGRLVPGVGVPIRAPEVLRDQAPAEILVLTWDLIDEIRDTLADLVAQGTRLLVAVPQLTDVTEGPAPPYDGEGRN